ncbi:hypothetical protein [Rhodococcus erythropolis]
MQTYRPKKGSVGVRRIIAYSDGDRVGPLPVTIEAVPAALKLLTAVPV